MLRKVQIKLVQQEELEDSIEPWELERPELMLPGQTKPDVPVAWAMKRMKLRVTLSNRAGRI